MAWYHDEYRTSNRLRSVWQYQQRFNLILPIDRNGYKIKMIFFLSRIMCVTKFVLLMWKLLTYMHKMSSFFLLLFNAFNLFNYHNVNDRMTLMKEKCFLFNVGKFINVYEALLYGYSTIGSWIIPIILVKTKTN